MHTMHLMPGASKQPNLELKTLPKQLLGSLPLVIALPGNVQQFDLMQYNNVELKLKLGLDN
jgi:hypothetical protein